MSTERTRLRPSLLAPVALAAAVSCSAPATAPDPYLAPSTAAWTAPGSSADATPTSTSSSYANYGESAAAGPETELARPTAVTQSYRQAPPPGMRQMRHQHFMLLLGARELENSTWEGMDEQFNLGFTFDKQLGDSGLAVDSGFQFSGDSTYRNPGNTKVYSDIFEFDLGLMKMFYPEEAPLRPYVGAGAAFTWASARIYNFYYRSDTDFSMGMYGRAGVAFQHSSGTLVGLDARYLGLTDMSLAGVDTDIDGWVFSLALGYGF